MHLNLDFIFSSLNPYTVLNNLKINVKKHENEFFTVCPSCNTPTLQVGSSELLCTNPSCTFISGNIIDFLAFLPKNDYKKAVKYIFNHYFDRLCGVDVDTSEFFQVNITEKLRNHRNILNLLIKLRENINNTEKCVESLQWFRKNYINPNLIGIMALPATYEQYLELLNLIYTDTEIPFVEIPKGNYIIFPYFSSFSSLSFIKAIHVSSNRTFNSYIHRSRYNYLGLHNSLMKDIDYKIYEDNVHVCTMLSYHRDNSDYDNHCISIHYDSTAVKDGMYIKTGTFMYNPKTDLSLPSKLSNVIKNFSITSNDALGLFHGETVSWQIFVLKQFKELVLEDQTFSPRISSFIETIDPNEELKNLLKRFLKTNGFNNILDHFQKFGFVDRIYKLKSYNVIETPDGYIAQKHNKPDRHPFTNFIIRFDHNLVFSDPIEIYHVGHLYMKGKKYPITIPRKNLSKYATIERSAIAAFKQGEAGLLHNTQIPCIIDTSFGSALSVLLNANTAGLRSYDGISYLGWSQDNQTFITPTWQSFSNDLRDTSKFRHPDVKIFEKYLFQDYQKDVEVYHNNDTVQILSLLVSLLCRSFLDLPYPEITIQNSSKARNILKFLFLPLGQVKPIDINSNKRMLQAANTQLKGLNKYPIYATCDNHEIIKELNFPTMILDTEGIPVQEQLTKEQYKGITALSHKIITEVTQWLLRTEGIDFTFSNELDVFNCMQEGLSVINNVCNLNLQFETKYVKFKQFLFQYSKEEIKKYVKLDLENQLMVICFWNSRVKRKEVYNELVQFNDSVKLRPTRYITADIEFIQNIVQDLYNEKIQFTLFEAESNKELDQDEDEDYQHESRL